MTPRTKFRPLAPITSTYRPAYPARLDPDEFRALVAARQDARLLNLAMAAAAIALANAACSDDNDASRTTGDRMPQIDPQRPMAPQDVVPRVLGILEQLESKVPSGCNRDIARVWRAEGRDRIGRSPRFVESIPIHFGNADSGIFDVWLARQYARRIFEAYGIDVTLPMQVRLGSEKVEALLDGVDRTRGLGFELRDMEPFSLVSRPAPYTVPNIAPSEALDDRELRVLEDRGMRLHVADPEFVYVEDQRTAITAYLLGIVDFLNSVTDGPDFDLRLLLDERRRHVDVVPTFEGGDPYPIECMGHDVEGGDQLRVVLAHPKRMILEIDANVLSRSVVEYGLRSHPRSAAADPKEPPPMWLSKAERWTDGGRKPRDPSAIRVLWQGPTEYTLVQRRADGSELRILPKDSSGDLPSAFDPTCPFRIECELPAGESFFPSRVVIGIPFE